EMREAHEFIVTNKIENSVEIMGPVIGQEKAELMSKADVFAFPPVAPEGHPLVILEAMSIGLPIIATFNGSIPETVIDGVNGFLVQVDDSISLAEKILLLSRDQSLRNSMGQKSREIFMEKFTKEVWINNLTRIFEQVLYEP
ncbi:MAG: glycosyltransferase, partial [Syntrophales bacterium]